mmetsp:Transcript_4133/g.10653  ORF Transcript_4133/g.10653 Transcript_4133/m.10653 type:complete len:270 (+) Transcript_4133:469-1278(+)
MDDPYLLLVHRGLLHSCGQAALARVVLEGLRHGHRAVRLDEGALRSVHGRGQVRHRLGHGRSRRVRVSDCTDGAGRQHDLGRHVLRHDLGPPVRHHLRSVHLPHRADEVHQEAGLDHLHRGRQHQRVRRVRGGARGRWTQARHGRESLRYLREPGHEGAAGEVRQGRRAHRDKRGAECARRASAQWGRRVLHVLEENADVRCGASVLKPNSSSLASVRLVASTRGETPVVSSRRSNHNSDESFASHRGKNTSCPDAKLTQRAEPEQRSS